MKSAGSARITSWLADKYPLTLIKNTVKVESTYTPAEIDAYVAEINADPTRMALLPWIVEAIWAIAAFPHAFETMLLEISDYRNKIPLETI